MTPSRQLHDLLRLAIFSLCFIVAFSGCTKKETEPLKLGFLGGITGRFSSLGIDGRDGTLLAVEQINAAGGINGQPIKLFIRDDKQDEITAQKALLELHKLDVAAVIGPLTSSMAVFLSPLSNQYKLVIVGPTISTNDLYDRDDYFFRIRPESKFIAKRLAEHMHAQGLKRISVIYDLNNRSHCESWYKALQRNFEALGGQVVVIKPFNSAERSSYFQLAESLLKTPTEGIFILAGSIDTGLISQQLNKLGYDKALFATEWTFTNDLLQMGGSAVEGMTIFHTFNPSGTSLQFQEFSTDYQQRFGRKPSFAAAHAFDATNFILAGLQYNSDPKQLKQTLLAFPVFQGMQTRIEITDTGDAERELFLTTVKNGKFVLIQ